MKPLVIPDPPDPDKFKGNVLEWQRQMSRWANDFAGRVETFSQIVATPAGQSLTLGSYTLTTSLTGTDSTSNFVCSLVKTLTDKGILKPV